MLQEEDLMTIEGWERDHYGDNICEWARHLADSEAHEDYGLFALVIQQTNEDMYKVRIDVAPAEGQLGDLLNSQYYDELDNVEEAMERGQEFVRQVEEEYNLD